MKLKRYADSIIVKTANSYQRILDEVGLFLHLVEENSGPSIKAPGRLGFLQDVLQGKKVLVADDDIRNIFSLTKALEKYQMTVVPATDGKDALKQLEDNPDVAVILMDMMMPEMDGYETIASIRKDPRYKDMPIIAVTAKSMMGIGKNASPQEHLIIYPNRWILISFCPCCGYGCMNNNAINKQHG